MIGVGVRVSLYFPIDSLKYCRMQSPTTANSSTTNSSNRRPVPSAPFPRITCSFVLDSRWCDACTMLSHSTSYSSSTSSPSPPSPPPVPCSPSSGLGTEISWRKSLTTTTTIKRERGETHGKSKEKHRYRWTEGWIDFDLFHHVKGWCGSVGVLGSNRHCRTEDHILYKAGAGAGAAAMALMSLAFSPARRKLRGVHLLRDREGGRVLLNEKLQIVAFNNRWVEPCCGRRDTCVLTPRNFSEGMMASGTIERSPSPARLISIRRPIAGSQRSVSTRMCLEQTQAPFCETLNRFIETIPSPRIGVADKTTANNTGTRKPDQGIYLGVSGGEQTTPSTTHPHVLFWTATSSQNGKITKIQRMHHRVKTCHTHDLVRHLSSDKNRVTPGSSAAGRPCPSRTDSCLKERVCFVFDARGLVGAQGDSGEERAKPRRSSQVQAVTALEHESRTASSRAQNGGTMLAAERSAAAVVCQKAEVGCCRGSACREEKSRRGKPHARMHACMPVNRVGQRQRHRLQQL